VQRELPESLDECKEYLQQLDTKIEEYTKYIKVLKQKLNRRKD